MLKRCIALLLAGVTLAGCGASSTTTGGVITTVPPVNVTITNDIAAIKAGVLTACGYVAVTSEVAAIVGTFVPGAGLVGQIISEICKAVTTKGARLGMATPQVNGVALHGYFDNRRGLRARTHSMNLRR